ncbi:MAG: AAA family ATPase [Myxococcales bacterium]|nr:AAA family ATPase [Myxococcales bacterium]
MTLRRVLSASAQSLLILGIVLAANVAPAQETIPAPAPIAAPASDPRIDQIHALISGTLDVGVDPQSLFEVSLLDEDAIAVESVRVRVLLKAVDEASTPISRREKHRTVAAPNASGTPTLRDDIKNLDASEWQTRIALDRARLEFYSLSGARREALLVAHDNRQRAARPLETEEERQARESETERHQVLEAARKARSEAERLVGEVLAQVIAVESQVRHFRSRLKDERNQLIARQDIVLGWQRRVRQAKASTEVRADATYDALRRALKTSRNDLNRSLNVLSASSSDVPSLGKDKLAEIPPEIASDHVRARQNTVERAISMARRTERTLQEDRASTLLDEISTFNRERLGLLAFLSPDKRSAITGFTLEGWDQARSEARHLSLVLRYHWHVVGTWLAHLRSSGSPKISQWRTVAMGIPWVILALLFVWLRRRTPVWLRLLYHRAGESDRLDRRTSPSIQRRAVRFCMRIHRPLEWLLLVFIVMWLLPARARGLLEVQLLASAIGWILGGALVVDVINAIAAGGRVGLVHEEDAVPGLRLRSLRLVGRTVVVFALILVTTARLVGKGTVYSWVFSTCWFTAIPIFLLLIRWWRNTVFERLERARKTIPLRAWILSNQSGWKSFLAAMLGAVLLFTTGTVKIVRGWFSDVDLVRRAHAYLFRRELDKLEETHESARLDPISADALTALHPEAIAEQWLPNPADSILEQVSRRVTDQQGGVIALVGRRGMGKSTLLTELSKRAPTDFHQMVCTSDTALKDIQQLWSKDASASGAPALMLLDDAQALLKPVIGGLARLDEIMLFTREHAARTVWVFAFDASIWPLLKRARDGRPLVDETHVLEAWDEVQIGALLKDRNQRAGIEPLYDDLLDSLAPNLDIHDRTEALRVKEVGYVRMLWDHVRGNPGVALEAWRTSLGVDSAGQVHVRALHVPDATALETLPDSSLFVLRAVLQLAPAAIEDIARATRLDHDQVRNVCQYGRSAGFFMEENERVSVTWPWLRPIIRILERRHLLVTA